MMLDWPETIAYLLVMGIALWVALRGRKQ